MPFGKDFFRDSEGIDRRRHAAVDAGLQQRLTDLHLRATVAERTANMDLQFVQPVEHG